MEGGTEDLSEDEDDDETETAITTPSSNGGFGGGFGGGWITPKNIGALKRSGNGEDEMTEPVKVCIMALLFFLLPLKPLWLLRLLWFVLRPRGLALIPLGLAFGLALGLVPTSGPGSHSPQ